MVAGTDDPDAPRSPRVRRWIHDPDAPRLELSVGEHPHSFIREACKQLASLYQNPRLWHPDLGWVRHSRARGIPRGQRAASHQRRTERREAFVLVLRALLRQLDLRTLRVGVPRPGDLVHGLSVDAIERLTGLPLWTIERAIADLTDAGFVQSEQPRQSYPGGYRGLPSVRRISPGLFRRIGMSVRLTLERQRAYRRHRWQAAREREERMRRPDSHPISVAQRRTAIRAGLANAFQAAPLYAGQAENESDGFRFVALCVEIRGSHPDWTPDAIREEARTRLRAPPGSPEPPR